MDEEELFEDEEDALDDFEKDLLDQQVILDPESREFYDMIIDKLLVVVDVISDGHPLRKYQHPFARRMIESVIFGAGQMLTALFARQSGKSETVANVVATLMIMLPVLARMFPEQFGEFRDGIWVGAFAPVDDQVDNLFGRIVSRLTSERAQELMAEPEINDGVKGRGRTVTLRSGSLVRKQTAHPRAIIEGRTYHLILIDEAQGADEIMVNKSIRPMASSTNGTIVLTGTPTYTKGIFYKAIQDNKRLAAAGRGKVRNHFEADWKAAGAENPKYRKFVMEEKRRLGEDSDEFKLSYCLVWILEKGQFATASAIEALGDTSMQTVKDWHKTPVVVGIDPARKQDSTIVTVVWVDWDRPDEFGMYEHRVLNWLDLTGMDWEAQYFKIVDFLSRYNVWAVGIDTGGIGDVVASRLKVLMPNIRIEELSSAPGEQSKRWKHLDQLIEKRMVGWPWHAKTRNLRAHKRFKQQMEDLQVEFRGPNMLAAAPDESGAFDDYPDSLAIACFMSKTEQQSSEVEVFNSPFYSRR